MTNKRNERPGSTTKKPYQHSNEVSYISKIYTGKEVKVFAKINTNEKILVKIHHAQIDEVLDRLNMIYGQGWFYVEDFNFETFMLRFYDSVAYEDNDLEAKSSIGNKLPKIILA